VNGLIGRRCFTSISLLREGEKTHLCHATEVGKENPVVGRTERHGRERALEGGLFIEDGGQIVLLGVLCLILKRS